MIPNVLLVLHASVVIAFTLRILLRADLGPTTRLAWFIVLAFLPYVGAVGYFLFGEVDLGDRANRRYAEIFKRIRNEAQPLLGAPTDTADLIPAPYRAAFQYAGSINGFHTRPGNRAELMPTPQDTVRRMVADIDAATDHVHVLYYIWLDDGTGRALAEALMRAATRGVTCRAMTDGLGSRALIKSPLWQDMRAAGVHLAVALPLDHPIKTVLTSRLDLRNHRKITVIDGKITYCGSRNSADPAFLIKAKYAPWVDIIMRFTGPVVGQNQMLFASDWAATTQDTLGHLHLDCAPDPQGFAAQVMGDGPTERMNATPQLFATLIGTALTDLTLSTPYFVPDATVLEALCAAAHRGVRVRLILPAQNDSWIVAAASRSYYRRLIEAGVEIHEFNGGLLHAKTLTIDGVVAMVGSSNLDVRSFNLNYENNILLYDHATTEDLLARQETYLADADRVPLSEVRAWPPHRRIWQNIVATLGPIL